MWLVVGWIFVALGAIGALLPLIPTVPFLLLAAFCFEKGSPRIHSWLIHHPRFGPPVVEWRKHRVIRWRAKIIATVGLAGSTTWTMLSERPFEVKVFVGLVCAAAMAFILTRKSQP